MSMLSGKWGQPEGSFKRLSNKQVESALEFIIKNEINLQEVIRTVVDGGGGALTPIAWARIKADGTIIVDEGFTSSTRTGIGVYSLDTDKAVGTSGSNPLSAVLATPSSASGDGGDGSSPFKAFDTYQVVATDTTTDPVWQYNETNGKFYLWGAAQDDIYIHTDSTFTTAPVQVDADGVPVRGPGYSGGLSHEGAYAWISGEGNALRCMRISDNTMFNFGGIDTKFVLCATDNLNALAGSGVSGPRVWTYNGDAEVKAWDPDITGESLGSAQLTYTLSAGQNALPATFDKDGYIWISQGGALKQASPIAATSVNHAFPTETPTGETLAASLGGSARLSYDPLRNVFYMCLISSDPNTYVYTYSNWTNGVASSGRWEFIAKFSGFCSIHYEPAQDLLFIANYSNSLVYRYAGYPKIRIDQVSVDDTTGPDNPAIDYDLNSAYMCFYKSDSTGDYGYVSGTKGATNYLIKISYNGTDISLGDFGSIVSSVLIAHGTITDTNTVKVELFRSLSPPIRADGQFNVAVFGKTA